MKKIYFLLLILLTVFSFSTINAQIKSRSTGNVPLHLDNTNQSDDKMTVAFNGWIYAGYMASNDSGYKIYRSIDGGTTWATVENVTVYNETFNDFDMVVTGNDTSDLRLWVAGLNLNTKVAYVDEYDGYTNKFITEVYDDYYTADSSGYLQHIAIASNYKAPGTLGTNGLGVIYSVSYDYADTLIMATSVDSGTTWNRKQVFYSPNYFFHRVSLAYGYTGQSYTDGYYYAAFELNPTYGDAQDNSILTFWALENDSIFGYANAVWVDSVNKSWAGLLSHPSVIAQRSATDNGTGGLSEMVLFNYDSSANHSLVKAVTTVAGPTSITQGSFIAQSINSINAAAPNGVYDATKNNFIYVVADSAQGFVRYNIVGRDQLSAVLPVSTPSGGFEGDAQYPNYTMSAPRIDINPVDTTADILWIGSNEGNGLTLFTGAQSITSGIAATPVLPAIKIYPNPADQYLNIVLPAAFSNSTRIEVYNVLGQNVFTQLQTSNTPVQINTGQWPEGNYFVRLYDGSNEQVKKFTIASQ